LQSFARAWLLPTIGVLALNGCGWRLQGSTTLPSSVSAVHIRASDTYTDFYRELAAQVRHAGKQVQEGQAGAIISIADDTAGQRVVSVSAVDTPEQYQVYYSIEYSIQVAGRVVVAAERTELNATYSYDINSVLAKQREQMTIQRELARQLADTVMRRLALVGTTQQQARTAQSSPP
jgi:LPS-assembly lipoprotein